MNQKGNVHCLRFALHTALMAFFATAICGCVSTNVVMRDTTEKYPPSANVEVLMSEPSKPYRVLATLESQGGVGVAFSTLIEDMRTKAATIGADAVVVIQGGSENIPQQLLYNPAIGSYQTLGGGNKPVLWGAAIKYGAAAASQPPAAVSGKDPSSVPAYANNRLSGTWQGVIRSQATKQAIRAQAQISENGDMQYHAENGVRIIGSMRPEGNAFSGAGVMYMPLDPQGRPLALFPDGSAQAQVTLTGQMAGQESLSGTYSGGGDQGVFDMSRQQRTK